MKNNVRFRTNYNGYTSETDKEKVNPVSVTIQNDTYSLKDIVEKFSREYPKSLQRLGYYDDTEDFDDIDQTRLPDFDLVDAYELKEKITEKYQTVSKKGKTQNIINLEKELQNEEKTASTGINNPADI